MTASRALGLIVTLAINLSTGLADDLPLRTVTQDNTRITESCRLKVPADTVLQDTDHNGVIHVAASDIEIIFDDGTIFRGAPDGVDPDAYDGYALRLENVKNVTLRGGRFEGYRAAVWATACDGLTLDGLRAEDMRRDRLGSTPQAEDRGDWLRPHYNDSNEWLTRYGASIYIEDSEGVVVRSTRVRHGQNGLVLDGVTGAKVYDNDFSFNSGWGIALWRSSDNLIVRNACDFCIRGYSHGVYNRGQDSAGILVFEQCSRNLFAENSVTHGGDGFFAHSGRAALGEDGKTHPPDWYEGRGNNENVIVDNDFSYAAAHGLECTFGFDNKIISNRLAGNAICGLWGGYSQRTVIYDNTFVDNGEAGYGLERGGVNIEHGMDNSITLNTFRNNRCGVHLWWDEDAHLARLPWAKANGTASKDNIVAFNTFAGDGDAVGIELRGPSETLLVGNEFTDVKTTVRWGKDSTIEREAVDPPGPVPQREPLDLPGTAKPVGARKHLAGRENIIMTTWGPWDHESPLVRARGREGKTTRWDLLAMPVRPTVKLDAKGLSGQLKALDAEADGYRYTLSAGQPGLHDYTLTIKAGEFAETIKGTLLVAQWDVRVFAWPAETDPRETLDAWRKLAEGPTAVRLKLGELNLPFAMGGPADLKLPGWPREARIGADHFGLVATTPLPLPAGRYRVRTLSDDGVRVQADEQTVIENWTHHGPTPNEGTFDVRKPTTVNLRVEHFEISGYAVLDVAIERVGDVPAAAAKPAEGWRVGDDLTVWPNRECFRKSEPWLVANHDKLRQARPRVLVLNFANDISMEAVARQSEGFAKAIAAATTYHGYDDPQAKPFIDYDIVRYVDMRESNPPAERAKANSNLLPRRNGAGKDFYFDYHALFSEDWAKRYGFENPEQPGEFLDLQKLIHRGMVHEVWFYANHTAETGWPGYEATEVKQYYDAEGKPMAGSYGPAGNGGSRETLPWTGHSLAVYFFNPKRGVGCQVENFGHLVEGYANHNAVGSLTPYLREFADLDIADDSDLPFKNFYALPYGKQNLIAYPAADKAEIAWKGETLTIEPYAATGGNVHLAPGARHHYDLSSPFTVKARLENYRRDHGKDGKDELKHFNIRLTDRYRKVAPDGQGRWVIYWCQSMPGLDNPCRDDNGKPMKNWWVYLLY